MDRLARVFAVFLLVLRGVHFFVLAYQQILLQLPTSLPSTTADDGDVSNRLVQFTVVLSDPRIGNMLWLFFSPSCIGRACEYEAMHVHGWGCGVCFEVD